MLDENAQPNEYVLRNLTDKDDPAYWAALKLMLPAMRGLPFDAQRHPGLLIGKSVTEWEMRLMCSASFSHNLPSPRLKNPQA